MSSVNKVLLVGHLGADPELRQSANQVAWCTMSMATNSRIKRQDEWVEQTEWHRVKVFGSQAEHCHRYLRKGRQIAVEGRLSTSKWTDREGHDRWSTDVLADRVVFLQDGSATREQRDATA